MPHPWLILGIGNCLLGDDGVGVHAVRLLQDSPPPETRLEDVGTDFLAAVPFLEESTHVLAIDAMEAGSPPGTLYFCRPEDLATDRRTHSLHGLGLSSVLDFMERPRRPRVWVLGVQPARIDYDLELSPPLAAILPRVVARARWIVAGFAAHRMRMKGHLPSSIDRDQEVRA